MARSVVNPLLFSGSVTPLPAPLLSRHVPYLHPGKDDRFVTKLFTAPYPTLLRGHAHTRGVQERITTPHKVWRITGLESLEAGISIRRL